jgi:hypothetical protein
MGLTTGAFSFLGPPPVPLAWGLSNERNEVLFLALTDPGTCGQGDFISGRSAHQLAATNAVINMRRINAWPSCNSLMSKSRIIA